jgi:fibronectin type 3 domain-containing protein
MHYFCHFIVENDENAESEIARFMNFWGGEEDGPSRWDYYNIAQKTSLQDEYDLLKKRVDKSLEEQDRAINDLK